MLRSIASAVPLALAIVLVFVGPGFTQTAPVSTTVTFSPLYIAVEPYLIAIITACVPVIIGIIWQQLSARLKILQNKQVQDAEAQAQGAFQTALSNAAGRWLAAQEGNVAALKVDVHSPGIATEVNKVQNLIPGTLTQIGVTPANVGEVVANGVVAKIGQLQAASPQPAAPTVVAQNVDSQTVNVGDQH